MLESVKSLREWVDHIDENEHLGKLSEFGKRGLANIACDILSEVDERYMLLPVDADGVPLHVGETVYDSKNNETKVLIIEFDCSEKAHVYCKTIDGNGMINVAPKYLTHVKPRTVEDVLVEFSTRVLNSGHQWGLDAQGTIAEYADELREMMGGAE